MVYNHLKDKVKSFLQPFAESGQPVAAEDIKAYFEKLRGDDMAIKAAGGRLMTAGGNDPTDGGSRSEQSGQSIFILPFYPLFFVGVLVISFAYLPGLLQKRH